MANEKETWLRSVYESLRFLSGDAVDIKTNTKTLEERIQIAVQAAMPKNTKNNWAEFAKLHFNSEAPDKISLREHYGTLVKWESDDKKHVVISPDIFVHDPWSEVGVPAGLDIDRFLPQISESVDSGERSAYGSDIALAIAKASGDVVIGAANYPSRFMFTFSEFVSQLASHDRGVMEAWKLRKSEEGGREIPYLPIYVYLREKGCRIDPNIMVHLDVLTMPPQLESDCLSPEEFELKKECKQYVGRMYLTTVYSWKT